jgi:predicted hydrolase (HD superfamily)
MQITNSSLFRRRFSHFNLPFSIFPVPSLIVSFPPQDEPSRPVCIRRINSAGPAGTIRQQSGAAMGVSYDEAEDLLYAWTEGASLRGHARAVEAVMRRAANRYGGGAADEPRWAIAGLLHDADYEKWPDEHPHRVVGWLRDHGEEEIAHAVAAHSLRWGVPHESTLDRVLFACDEVTGFVVACALVRPEGISTLTPSSVLKKLKDKAFAAKVDRDEVRAGAELLGVPLADHVALVIEALIPHAAALGLAGKAGQDGGETA